MLFQKHVSVGSFLKKGEEIKDGDIVEVLNEGKQVEGNFGTQNLFMVKTASGKEGNVSFNQTSLNCMIDAFGQDSASWVGKKVKVWAILSNVQGKMVKVYYFTSPEAQLDESGNWSTPGTQGVTPKKAGEEGYVSVDEIPF